MLILLRLMRIGPEAITPCPSPVAVGHRRGVAMSASSLPGACAAGDPSSSLSSAPPRPRDLPAQPRDILVRHRREVLHEQPVDKDVAAADPAQ